MIGDEQSVFNKLFNKLKRSGDKRESVSLWMVNVVTVLIYSTKWTS